MTAIKRSAVIAALAAVSLLIGAVAATAGPLRNARDEVRAATAPFHLVAAATAAGYEEFLGCFDSDKGGMGQHYVNFGLVDATVELTAPEAVMYELGAQGPRLVGVEYIVPADAWTDDEPPTLLRRQFHLEEELGVWTLHFWVWRFNPRGPFSDWNPRVAPCPAG